MVIVHVRVEEAFSDGLFTFVQVEQFSTGDVIRILDDIATVHDLQENHGGWVDDMALVGDSNASMSLLLTM